MPSTRRATPSSAWCGVRPRYHQYHGRASSSARKWAAAPTGGDAAVRVLVLVETTDLIFAVDSTRDLRDHAGSLHRLHGNVLAILGLRALYFCSPRDPQVPLLKLGLSAVLVFVGAKMLRPTSTRCPGACRSASSRSCSRRRSWPVGSSRKRRRSNAPVEHDPLAPRGLIRCSPLSSRMRLIFRRPWSEYNGRRNRAVEGTHCRASRGTWGSALPASCSAACRPPGTCRL